VRPEPARPDIVRRELARPEPPGPEPVYRSTAPVAPSWYRPEPEPPPVRPAAEPVYRSTAPVEAPRHVAPPPERRAPEPPRYVPPPQPRLPAQVETPLAPRPQAPGRAPGSTLPAPGFARGLPAPSPAPPAPLPPVAMAPAQAPPPPGYARGLPTPPVAAPPGPLPAPGYARGLAMPVAAPPAQALPAPGYARGLPAPAPAPPASLQPVVAAPAALPTPGYARGLPAAIPAPAAPPLPPVVPVVAAPAPAQPAARPASQPQPASRFGPSLPAPVAAPAPRPAAPIANAQPEPIVRQARPRPMGPLEIDRVRYEDLPAILDLVNADLLPGQPTCDRQALEAAMRGESTADESWWRELSNVRVAVASRGGTVVGAASYATAAADHSGWLLWLHAREERQVVGALIDRAIADLNGSSHLYAFWIATALSLGVEALPVEQQPVTHELLTSRGLMGRDSWRYLVMPIERFALDDRPEEVAAVRPISGPGEVQAWELVIGAREEPQASAEIALAGEGCGQLKWIDVEPAQRGRGVGRRLLRQALRFLALRGAQTVAAFVDHADPRERDPGAVLRLLGSAGFQEVDRLWSYESPRRRR
jgi:ribosomal protein S18 acetylase RimI-like enzyme